MQDIVSQGLNIMSKDNRYKEIFIEDIRPSKLNIYPMIEIEELAKNISETGLLHPINVLQIEDGMFEILSGERRYRAMRMLYEKGNDEFEMIPAIVKIRNLDEREKKRCIRRGNASRSNLTVEQKVKITKESLEDFYISKECGEIPVGTLKRDWIASDTGFGKTSVQTYLNIIEGKEKKKKKEKTTLTKNLEKKIMSKVDAKVVITDKALSFKYVDNKDLQRILRILGLSDIIEETVDWESQIDDTGHVIQQRKIPDWEL